VSEDTWNFTVTWPGQQHRKVAACRHVLLVMHGIDTFGHVVLNGRHVLAADNAHRCVYHKQRRLKSCQYVVPSKQMHCDRQSTHA
jgi:hypothetical protein